VLQEPNLREGIVINVGITSSPKLLVRETTTKRCARKRELSFIPFKRPVKKSFLIGERNISEGTLREAGGIGESEGSPGEG
jgi:hypothetical protein